MVDAHESRQSSSWQEGLNPRLVQRLMRPRAQPGVIENRLARSIVSRSEHFSSRLPLLESLKLRHQSYEEVFQADSLPIVYAQPQPAELTSSGLLDVPSATSTVLGPEPVVVQAKAKLSIAPQPELLAHPSPSDVSSLTQRESMPTVSARRVNLPPESIETLGSPSSSTGETADESPIPPLDRPAENSTLLQPPIIRRQAMSTSAVPPKITAESQQPFVPKSAAPQTETASVPTVQAKLAEPSLSLPIVTTQPISRKIDQIPSVNFGVNSVVAPAQTKWQNWLPMPTEVQLSKGMQRLGADFNSQPPANSIVTPLPSAEQIRQSPQPSASMTDSVSLPELPTIDTRSTPPEVDIEQLTDKVYDRICQKVSDERDRWGIEG